MADAFTGFWDAHVPGGRDQVYTTMAPVELDELLGRLRERLLALPPGSTVRIDLISWRDGE